MQKMFRANDILQSSSCFRNDNAQAAIKPQTVTYQTINVAVNE